jgi:hypothetical protein
VGMVAVGIIAVGGVVVGPVALGGNGSRRSDRRSSMAAIQ